MSNKKIKEQSKVSKISNIDRTKVLCYANVERIANRVYAMILPIISKVPVRYTHIHVLKDNIGYFLLAFELYSILFQDLMVKLWVIANTICTFMFMYNNLSDPNIRKRFLHIGDREIKLFSGITIGTGIVLLLFFSTSIGTLMIPFILYLIHRTAKNAFE